MQQAERAGLLVIRLLASDGVRADRRNLHIVEPLDQLLAVFEARLVELAVRKERLLSFLIESIQPPSVKHHYVVLFDWRVLPFGGREQVFQGYAFAAFQMLFAFMAGPLRHEAAPDYSILPDRLDIALLPA